MTYNFAVEVKPSQVKKRLGWTRNAYIVAGQPVLYIYSDMNPDRSEEQFEVISQQNASKNAILKLEATDKPIDDFEPRPTRATGWTKTNKLWQYTEQPRTP